MPFYMIQSYNTVRPVRHVWPVRDRAPETPAPPLLSPETLLVLTAMLFSEKEAWRICEKFLSYSHAEDAQVSIGAEDYSPLRFAANNFTTNGRRQQVSASITVWINKKR